MCVCVCVPYTLWDSAGRGWFEKKKKKRVEWRGKRERQRGKKKKKTKPKRKRKNSRKRNDPQVTRTSSATRSPSPKQRATVRRSALARLSLSVVVYIWQVRWKHSILLRVLIYTRFPTNQRDLSVWTSDWFHFTLIDRELCGVTNGVGGHCSIAALIADNGLSSIRFQMTCLYAKTHTLNSWLLIYFKGIRSPMEILIGICSVLENEIMTIYDLM